MNLVQLQQLVEIAQQKTLSGAAETLHISQPALSRSMQKLEEDLQAPLFTRTKNHIQLNDTGELAVGYAKTVLRAVSAMRTGILDFEKKKRTIPVGSCAPAPLWKLLPLLSALYPEATISSEIKNTPQVVEGLRDGRYQVAVLPHAAADRDLLSFPLCREHLFVSVPPAHPAAAAPGLHLRDLNGETMLLLSNIGFWGELTREKMPGSHFIVQEKAVDHKELVRSSALPSFVSDLSMTRETALLPRVFVPILDPEANPRFYCVIRKDLKRPLADLVERLRAAGTDGP